MRDFGKAEIISGFRAGSIEGNVDPSLPQRYLSYVESFKAPAETRAGVDPNDPSTFAGLTTNEIMQMINPAEATLETTDIKFQSTKAEIGKRGISSN